MAIAVVFSKRYPPGFVVSCCPLRGCLIPLEFEIRLGRQMDRAGQSILMYTYLYKFRLFLVELNISNFLFPCQLEFSLPRILRHFQTLTLNPYCFR